MAHNNGPQYHVGDVVNGHRWNGQQWVPVQRRYEVGDIANGHRWDGNDWVPVASTPAASHESRSEAASRVAAGLLGAAPSPVANAQTAKSSKMSWAITAAAGVFLVGLLVVSLSGNDPDSEQTVVSEKAPVVAADEKPSPEPESAPTPEEPNEPEVTETPTASASPSPEPNGIPTVGSDEAAQVGDLRVQVLSVEDRGKTVGSGYSKETAVGTWIVVTMTVENVGDEAVTFYDGDVRLIDDQGRKMKADSWAGAMALDSDAWISSLNPGIVLTQALAFDVPEGTTARHVWFDPDWFDDGVMVDVSSPPAAE